MVITSCNRLDWWTCNLAAALAQHNRVVNFPIAGYGEPGHAPESNINMMIGAHPAPPAFYLGSLASFFPGTTDLPMPTAVWADFSPEHGHSLVSCLRLFDVVFSSQRDVIPAILAAGATQVDWLPFAFDSTLENNPSADKRYDVGFVGSLDQPATREERCRILAAISAKFRMNDYQRPAYGAEMMRIYNQSKIVVNIPVPGGFNMRTFEALASGALLLTKAVGNGQRELFEDGRHFVTYQNEADLLEKIRYYLSHDAERREIAETGRAEVVRCHTYSHRADQVVRRMQRIDRVRTQDPAVVANALAVLYRKLGRPDLLARMAFGRGMPARSRIRLGVAATRKLLGGILAMRKSSRDRNPL